MAKVENITVKAGTMKTTTLFYSETEQPRKQEASCLDKTLTNRPLQLVLH